MVLALSFRRDSRCPRRFILSILRSQTGHKANVIWVRGAEAGLVFESTFSLQSLDDPSLGYLKRIWLAHT